MASTDAMAQRWLGVWKPPSRRPRPPAWTIRSTRARISASSGVRLSRERRYCRWGISFTMQKAVSGAEKKLQVT